MLKLCILINVGDEMLDQKNLQKILDKTFRNIHVPMDLIDETGEIMASTDRKRIGQTDSAVKNHVADDEKSSFVYNGRTYVGFETDKGLEYYISMEGTGRVVRNYCLLTVPLLQVYLNSTHQKMDQDEFLRRVLLDQVSDLEFQEWVREFNIEIHAKRCIFVIQTLMMKADYVYDILLKAFPKTKEDFLVLTDSRTVVLIKNISDDMDNDDLIQLAAAMEETILNEASIKSVIGIGKSKDSIFSVRESYLEALEAIEVGKVFNLNSRIYLYEKLLLERFLYAVSSEKCHSFYREIFSDDIKKILTDEMILTIEKFFENSLNLSETARQLYIHRNTLVYRLDKIQKALGLDLRNFHDAVTFKIMMMLERQLRECCN